MFFFPQGRKLFLLFSEFFQKFGGVGNFFSVAQSAIVPDASDKFFFDRRIELAAFLARRMQRIQFL